jgi:predicted phosphodiesterase
MEKSFDLVSDLHTEFSPWKQSTLPTSRILVIAGDYSTAHDHNKTIEELLELPYEHVVFVLGNHDFYGCEYHDTYCRWLAWPEDHPKLHVLVNRSMLVDGIVFVGSTLWSDTSKDGCGGYRVKQALSDYTAISSFKIDTAQKAHACAVQYLDKVLTETQQPVVVVTHHLPSFSCVDPKYADCKYNAGFATNLDYLLQKHADKIRVWVHGHTHAVVEKMIQGVHVVCNPRGYPGENVQVYVPKQIDL